MARLLHGTLLGAGLILAIGAEAQPSHPYPGTGGFAPPADRDAPWFQACLRVEAVRPPAPAPSLPPSCAAFDYYDKLHQAVTSDAEWAGVRACALASSNNVVLSMLYANGLGVQRNLDLATQYACSGDQLPGMQLRVSELQELASGARTGRFDQCDDRSSGAMQAACAGIDERQAEKVRLAFIARLRRQLPVAQQEALDQLVAAGWAYAASRPRETEGNGSAAAAWATMAEGREKEWLREHLAGFEKGDFHLSPPQELPEDEAELDRLVAAINAAPSRNPDRLPDSTIKKADVRATEDLWLAYRDAWVRFAALRYPAVPADAIKVELTTWRSQLLRPLALTFVETP